MSAYYDVWRNANPNFCDPNDELDELVFDAGMRSGMERAAEIANDEHLDDKYKHGCSNTDAAEAIRKEIDDERHD